jgi:hypothetical protein
MVDQASKWVTKKSGKVKSSLRDADLITSALAVGQ